MFDLNNKPKWSVTHSGVYRPIGGTAHELKAGTYRLAYDPGLCVVPMSVVTDDLIELPDPTSADVMAGIEKFWTMEDRYKKHGLLYKRSIGFYGPPGSGKTATIIMIAKKMIGRDGLVFMFNDNTPSGLAEIRRRDPDRRIVCIIEELDHTLKYDEEELLSLLDGETQINGVVYLAATNHYEKLPQTIVNRPSRFDEWIYVGMPSEKSRAVYLRKAAKGLCADELATWVRDTEGFSIAHLKELVIAVLCLDHPYEMTLKRLRAMLQAEKEENGTSNEVPPTQAAMQMSEQED